MMCSCLCMCTCMWHSWLSHMKPLQVKHPADWWSICNVYDREDLLKLPKTLIRQMILDQMSFQRQTFPSLRVWDSHWLVPLPAKLRFYWLVNWWFNCCPETGITPPRLRISLIFSYKQHQELLKWKLDMKCPIFPNCSQSKWIESRS